MRILITASALAIPAAAGAQDAVTGAAAEAAAAPASETEGDALAAPFEAPVYESEPTLTIGVGLSTFGITVTPEARLSDNIGIRAPVGFLTIERTFDIEGNDVDGEVTSAQGAMLFDYYPTGGGFRVSAGLGLGGYQVDARGTDLTVTDTATGTDYTVNGDYSARIEQDSNIAPMLSVGFASPADNRVRVSLDVGAKYTRYGLSVDTTELQADPNFDQTDVDQLIADFNRDAEDYPFTPYVHLSVTIRF